MFYFLFTIFSSFIVIKCKVNLSSVTAQSFIKLSIHKACASINKFDVIYLSEMYLDSSVSTNKDDLEIAAYSLCRTDHLNI